RPATRRSDGGQRGDRPALAATCRTSLGRRRSRRRQAGGHPRTVAHRNSRRGHGEARDSRVRGAVSQPTQPARADLPRPFVLRPARQRRPHSGHHRQRGAWPLTRSVVLHATPHGARAVSETITADRNAGPRIWWLAFGYFASYICFSALVTAI